MVHSPLRILTAAGPTHERIDAVRYLANRSSGRMGEALADAAVERGASVTLLLGPTSREPARRWLEAAIRFESCSDLQALLRREAPRHDCLFMAAAVADHRPATVAPGKLRREAGDRNLQLIPTPDLLAETTEHRRPGQFMIGFALETPEELDHSAREKLRRKRVDAIVANELETMGSLTIRGRVYLADGRVLEPPSEADAAMSKVAFCQWLMETLLPLAERRRAEA